MRTIKTLGIATAMALALVAIAGAASASANVFKTETEATAWSGQNAKAKGHLLSLGGAEGESWTCSGVSFSGSTATKTSNTLTVPASLGGCTFMGLSESWATNGCKYRFHPGASPSLTGTMDIVGCETAMVDVREGGLSCKLEIGNQNGLGPVEYQNEGTGSTRTVKFVANLTELTYTRTGAGCFGANGTFHNGTYAGSWSVQGSASGKQAPVWVESTPPTVFAAEESPVNIAGGYTGSATQMMSLPGAGILLCTGYTLTGTSATAIAGSLTLTPSYHGCTFSKISIPDSSVHMGGCSYRFYASGALDIAGANCASDPITISRPGCVVTVGPQSGIGGTRLYTNNGSAKSRTVSMAGSNTGITSVSTGGNCLNGTFTSAEVASPATLAATNSGGAAQGISVE